jgi:hypothetical protein
LSEERGEMSEERGERREERGARIGGKKEEREEMKEMKGEDRMEEEDGAGGAYEVGILLDHFRNVNPQDKGYHHLSSGARRGLLMDTRFLFVSKAHDLILPMHRRFQVRKTQHQSPRHAK